MLRITKSQSASSAKSYFREALLSADYYLEGRAIAGRWHGLGAARLGLAGVIDEKDFISVLENRSPDGSQITPRNKAERIPGYDFTFSPPKSVSVLWAVSQDDRILDAHRTAVHEAMGEVERNMETRVRVGQSAFTEDTRKTGNTVWAEFEHDTARPVDGTPDPHLHTHAYLVNATFDEAEGRWKAAQIRNLAGEREYYEAVYHAAVAREMKAMGFDIERLGKSFEISGVSRPLIEKFSRRTAEVEATAAAKGILSDKAKDSLGVETRDHKLEPVAYGDLPGVWKSRLLPQERAEIDAALRAAEGGGEGRQVGAVQSWRAGLSDAFENQSVAREKAVLTSALRYGFGDVRLSELKAAAEMSGLIRGEIDGRVFVTTDEVLREEERMIALAREGRLACRPLGHGEYEIEARFLNEQQRAAVQQIWDSPDRAMILRGGAGVGKTTLLKEAVAGLQAGGHAVYTFAPASGGVEALAKDIDAPAHTLAFLLKNEAMHEKLRGATLVIDEAGQVSVPDMARVFDLADRHDWRVILSGDFKQHGSVGRGDALRLLQDRAGLHTAEVTEIVRQKGAYKEAVEAIGAGDVTEGWDRLERMGAVIELPDGERFGEVARDYVAERSIGRSVLVVAPTHAEKNAITAEIRDGLKAEGLIGKEARVFERWRDVRWTTAQREDRRNYRVGQRIKMFQNGRKNEAGVSLKSGSFLEVVALAESGPVMADSEGNRFAVPLDRPGHFKVYDREEIRLAKGDRIRTTEQGKTVDGRKVATGTMATIEGFTKGGDLILEGGRALPRDFRMLDYGYCTTSFVSQGASVDTVIAALGTQSLPATSLEQFYVTASRGKQAVRIYTNDKDAVRDATAQSSARGSAIELLEGEVDRRARPKARSERMKEFANKVAPVVKRLMQERGRDIPIDKDLIREAKNIVMAQGRETADRGDRGAAIGD